MTEHGELIYGLTVAVDIENFSKLDTLDQYAAQSALGEVLDTASGRAGLDRETWYRQVRGDGELAVLPADTDVAWVVARLPHELGGVLSELRTAGSWPRLRLRLAMHHGTLTRGRFGPVGQAPIVVSRLLDARAVRRALAGTADRDLVLVVSSTLFHEVVKTRFYGMDPTLFASFRVTAKGATYLAHVTTEPVFSHSMGPLGEEPPPTSLNNRLLETT
ncbi:hypothetical protein [Spirillospora sp. CA-294931]|uniref:hypothetical protein n=1 Tax=Spirillospora sp. CA-294931 TaxID=3240042 RepID=UPI003D8A10AC